MIDVVHFADTCCVVALGIDSDGTKYPLSVVDGDTESTTTVAALLAGLRERSLDVTRPVLEGIDGSTALRKAVAEVCDHPIVQRCQLHKICNVKVRLPQKLRTNVGRKVTQAYQPDSVLEAEAMLENLASELERTHPGAAASRCSWGGVRDGVAGCSIASRTGAGTFRIGGEIPCLGADPPKRPHH